MDNFLSMPIRVSAFVRKELFEILRQPRLILTLVLGPFLILLLFGIGYRNEARVLRTVFVVDTEDSAIAREIEKYRNLGPQLDFVDIITERDEAERMLQADQVDLVVVVPFKAYETIRGNNQAIFTLIHNEIDPLQADYVRVFGRVYIDEVNRRVLRDITERSQNQALGLQQRVTAAQENVSNMRAALEEGDVAGAVQEQEELTENLDILEEIFETNTNFLESVEQTLGEEEDKTSQTARTIVEDANRKSQAIEIIEEGQESYNQQLEQLRNIQQDLALLNQYLGEFEQIDSKVLVSPFISTVEGIAEAQPDLVDYFAPGVIVLLLQHLAVTFSALSLVREAQLGTIELFRVSPVSAGETLIGKYISYLMIGLVLGAILTAILISDNEISFSPESTLLIGLGVPMLGQWVNYFIVVTLLLFAALGIGFVISLIVETDSQAVQYAMIVLLSSVFFSGFFLSIEAILPAVRTVSWMLPATYAILLLQDIMLRGNSGNPQLLLGLAGIGSALYIIAWLLFQRSMARE